MATNNEKIVFTTDDGEEVEFYVLEQTKINGNNYLLIADAYSEEEANALILKEKTTDDNEIVYDIVENDNELDAVSKVFEQIMDDIDIEMNKDS